MKPSMVIPGLNKPAYLTELQTLCARVRSDPDALDAPSAASWVRAKVLRPAASVCLMSQGFHSAIYARSLRQRPSTRPNEAGERPLVPVLGTLYGAMLFDTYRRPYKFTRGWQRAPATRVAQHIAHTWLQRRQARARGDLEQALAPLGAVLDQLEHEGQGADADSLQGRMNKVRADFAAHEQRTDGPLHRVAQALQAALLRLRRREYPTIDLFLEALLAELHGECQRREVREGAEALKDVVLTAFDVIARANAAGGLHKREVWPQFNHESAMARADLRAGLYLEGLLAQGNPRAFNGFDVLPVRAGQMVGARPQAPGWMRWMMRLNAKATVYTLRSQEQPLGIAALQEARRALFVGMHYFDERLQRHVALSPDQLGRKSADVAAAKRAHNETVRQRALAALAEPVRGVRDPKIRAVLEEARLRQREAIAAQDSFPTFADVPWKVTAREVAQLRDKHVVQFASMPLGRKRANCNALSFAFLREAAALQEAATQKPVVLRGGKGLRSIGAGHRVRLALGRPRAAP